MTRWAGTILRLVLAVLLAAMPVTPARAAGNCGVFYTYGTTDTVTASNLNGNFTQAATTNSTFQCLDDYSATAGQMNTTTDPNSSGSASLATSGAGELERLRHVLQHTLGFSNWWRHYEDLNLGARGLRNHFTILTAYKDQFRSEATWSNAAVRFHALAVSVVDGASHPESVLALFHVSGTTRLLLSKSGDLHIAGSIAAGDGTVQYPSYTAVRDHQTGLFFPAQNHLGVTIGRAEIARFHGYGMVLAPHAALAFRHAGGQLHVTGVSLGSSDAVQVGDTAVALQFRGAGITTGADRLWGLNALGTAVEAKVISGGNGITITHQAGQIVFSGAGAALWGSRGQFSGTGGAANAGHVFTLRAHAVQFMNATTHAITTVVNPSAVQVNYTTTGPVANGRDRAAAVADAGNLFVHYYWIYDGATVAGVASPNAPGVGPNLPHSYTSWSYAGPVRVDGTAQLVGTHIVGAMAYYAPHASALIGGTSTTEAVVDLSSLVPTNATSVTFVASITNTAAAARTAFFRAVPGVTTFAAILATSERDSPSWTMPNVSQNLYYQLSGATITVDVGVRGYAIPNGGL